MTEENEILTEEMPEKAKAPFVPSPAWKRTVAWVLFAIVALGIVSWLLNMAYPGWIDAVKAWFR